MGWMGFGGGRYRPDELSATGGKMVKGVPSASRVVANMRMVSFGKGDAK